MLVSFQNRAARVRVGKGDKPVTYEQALAPHQIAHRKGWLSQHTSKWPFTLLLMQNKQCKTAV